MVVATRRRSSARPRMPPAAIRMRLAHMTITRTPPGSTALDSPSAGRRTMVTLAVIYLGFFVVLMATGADREPDADPAKLIADYDLGRGAVQVITYAAVVAAAVVVFLGAALRSVLVAGTRRWTANVVLV